MTTGATGQLGLALPVQGELSGSWGNTVNNGITEYTNIAIAGTLTLTGDGAVTLANTTGDASASYIVSTLTGAGTVTAQFAIVKVTGTLTTAKVVTGPSYSKTYVVDNAATGDVVTFKAAGQAGVSVAVGEKCTVYFNGTDYVKVASSTADGVTTFSAGTTGFTPNSATSGAVTLAGTLATANGGTNLGGATPFTSGGVLYASSTSALATGAVLSFDGTNLGIGTSSPTGKLQVSGSASNVASIVTNTNTAGQASLSLATNTAALYSAAFGSTAGGTTWAGLTGNSQTVIEAQNSSSFVIGAFNNSAPIIFAQGRAEIARFDTVGNVLVGGTAARGTTAGTAHLDLFNGTAPAGTLTNGVSLYSASGDLKFMDAAGNAYSVGYRNIPQSGSAKTTSYTLATTDVGEFVEVGASGAIVIPDATFSTGDAVVIFNNTSGSITITCSITTAYIGGQNTDAATVTLLTRGVCNVFFISGTVCVITGNVTA